MLSLLKQFKQFKSYPQINSFNSLSLLNSLNNIKFTGNRNLNYCTKKFAPNTCQADRLYQCHDCGKYYRPSYQRCYQCYKYKLVVPKGTKCRICDKLQTNFDINICNSCDFCICEEVRRYAAPWKNSK